MLNPAYLPSTCYTEIISGDEGGGRGEQIQLSLAPPVSIYNIVFRSHTSTHDYNTAGYCYYLRKRLRVLTFVFRYLLFARSRSPAHSCPEDAGECDTRRNTPGIAERCELCAREEEEEEEDEELDGRQETCCVRAPSDDDCLFFCYRGTVRARCVVRRRLVAVVLK